MIKYNQHALFCTVHYVISYHIIRYVKKEILLQVFHMIYILDASDNNISFCGHNENIVFIERSCWYRIFSRFSKVHLKKVKHKNTVISSNTFGGVEKILEETLNSI